MDVNGRNTPWGGGSVGVGVRVGVIMWVGVGVFVGVSVLVGVCEAAGLGVIVSVGFWVCAVIGELVPVGVTLTPEPHAPEMINKKRVISNKVNFIVPLLTGIL